MDKDTLEILVTAGLFLLNAIIIVALLRKTKHSVVSLSGGWASCKCGKMRTRSRWRIKYDIELYAYEYAKARFKRDVAAMEARKEAAKQL